eukprot:gene4332-4905_t
MSEMEIRQTIVNLSKGKSTGIDEIPAEFLQNMGDKGMEMITLIINKCYNTGLQPEDFLKSIFIQLPKECAEHRAISLISHTAKILLHILKRRITPLAEKRMSENQLGFREGPGRRDAICQIRLLAERMVNKNKKIFACFIDYKKAFDKVNHGISIRVLKKYEVPPEEVRLTSNLYWSQTAQIRGKSEDSSSIKIEKGVRQGCVLSPVFCNMYSEELINDAAQDESGLELNGMIIINIRFADDTVLLASTEEDLQRLIDKINESCTANGMELNAKKTKTARISFLGGRCDRSKTAVQHQSRDLVATDHIPGKDNVVADLESGATNIDTEWVLNPHYLAKALSDISLSPTIDLFASRVNKQFEEYVSYRPDPYAKHIDAFSISWSDQNFYCFPPFSCIMKTVRKIVQGNARGILVVPDWSIQTRYPILLAILEQPPILLRSSAKLWTIPSQPDLSHPLHKSLKLTICLVSGKLYK